MGGYKVVTAWIQGWLHMIKFDEIGVGIENIIMPTDRKNGVENEGEIMSISQSDIMNRINVEFQKPFIKNLYRHIEWQQRVFWAVAGSLQNAYDDLEVDVSLDRITTSINRYIKDGVQDLHQRDAIKLIRDAIHNLQEDGITKISSIISEVTSAGITEARFDEYIIQMKREGSIFEPKTGYYKCVG